MVHKLTIKLQHGRNQNMIHLAAEGQCQERYLYRSYAGLHQACSHYVPKNMTERVETESRVYMQGVMSEFDPRLERSHLT